jgi:hypothetical protein
MVIYRGDVFMLKAAVASLAIAEKARDKAPASVTGLEERDGIECFSLSSNFCSYSFH